VYPYLLLVVEPKSHFVLGVAMLGTENQTYDALIASNRICQSNGGIDYKAVEDGVGQYFRDSWFYQSFPAMPS
jgi:hypothetical protein